MDGYVVEAEIELTDGTDPAAVGAAVTVELCGHWEHEGDCRWPHHSDIDADARPARFRTVFQASPDEEADIRARIERALRGSDDWRVTNIKTVSGTVFRNG